MASLIDGFSTTTYSIALIAGTCSHGLFSLLLGRVQCGLLDITTAIYPTWSSKF